MDHQEDHPGPAGDEACAGGGPLNRRQHRKRGRRRQTYTPLQEEQDLDAGASPQTGPGRAASKSGSGSDDSASRSGHDASDVSIGSDGSASGGGRQADSGSPRHDPKARADPFSAQEVIDIALSPSTDPPLAPASPESGTPVPVEDSPEWAAEVRVFFLESVREFGQFCLSIFGLATFIGVYAFVFLGESLVTVDMVGFLLVTAVGLTIFGMGLRRGLMPLGEAVGQNLPQKASRAVVFIAIFSLGVLCTIAEPAIGALQTAGRDTDRTKAPLLALMLDGPVSLMLAVGVGVGVASVAGCLRLLLRVSIRICLFLICLPTIILTLALVARGGSLPAVTGLAWDCGAVTTGPVTVPIVLALGIGVATPPKADAAGEKGQRKNENSAQEVKIQKQDLLDGIEDGHGQDQDEQDDLQGFGVITFASLFPVLSIWTLALLDGGNAISEVASTALQHAQSGSLPQVQHAAILSEGISAMQAVVPLAGFLVFLQIFALREVPVGMALMLWGLMLCLIGMWIFRLGLSGGLVPLGEAAGSALPKATERYGSTMGPLLILVFGFLAGAIATFSEPGLVALGNTVEKLTKGRFPKFKLISAVALGVGFGIMLGLAKVYFDFQLWPILFVGYSACLALTQLCKDEAVVCIAWDSAGVTTGPITVPVVLASGLSLGLKSGASEGFGILSCASIGPIISVLITGILNARAEAASAADSKADSRLPSAVAPQVVGAQSVE